jgi:hypothetical protein
MQKQELNTAIKELQTKLRKAKANAIKNFLRNGIDDNDLAALLESLDNADRELFVIQAWADEKRFVDTFDVWCIKVQVQNEVKEVIGNEKAEEVLGTTL